MSLKELTFICGNVDEDTPIQVFTSMDNLIADNALCRDYWNFIPAQHFNREVRFFRLTDGCLNVIVI